MANPKRTVLITGASRGIGSAIANFFKLKKFNVITPLRSELDLLSDSSIQNYINSVSDKKIDIIVNNAGINTLAKVHLFSDKELYETLQINLVAPLKIIRGLAPVMMKNNYGRIVNISSIWSIVSKSERVMYSSAKAAINSMTRTAAIELGEYNILVNAVAPGFVNTELTTKNNSIEALEKIKMNIPLKRLAEPSEIAELIGFLCSDNNTYITGQTIAIDGGYTCQ